MDSRRLDLGLVRDVEAETFGEPGNRTFRLHVTTGEGRVSLWLEKEQLAILGSAIGELLDRVPEGSPAENVPDTESAFMGDLEVRVGSLSLGYDRERNAFALVAGDFESAFELTSISLLTTRNQVSAVREQVEKIVAAGRPRCPLCGRPLGSGPHFCPESNGHARLPTSSD